MNGSPRVSAKNRKGKRLLPRPWKSAGYEAPMPKRDRPDAGSTGQRDAAGKR
jgi:hypothetical protein